MTLEFKSPSKIVQSVHAREPWSCAVESSDHCGALKDCGGRRFSTCLYSGSKRMTLWYKRNQWQQFCNTIGRDTKISDVWGMIRRMGGIRREYALPAIRYNGEIMVTNKDKADALAKSFAKIHSSANLTQEARAGRDEVIRVHPNTVKKKNDTAEASNVCFSLFELKRALAGARFRKQVQQTLS